MSQPSPNGKSTEHNIDTFAFFTMLAALTGNGVVSMGMRWLDLAQHARKFVHAMYNAEGQYFYTGTLGDQITINTSPIPEDVQTWSYMALLNNKHKVTIDWALRHLEATDTASAPHSSLSGSQQYTGLVFDTASLTTTTADPQAVWLEGTSHMIAALVARVFSGQDNVHAIANDAHTAVSLLQQVVGHGIAAKVSARLGEGVLNGLLTARIGLCAMAVCRPMPFAAERAPTLRKVVPFLFRGEDKG